MNRITKKRYLSLNEFVNIDENLSMGELFEFTEKSSEDESEKETDIEGEITKKRTRKKIIEEELSGIEKLGDTTEVEPEVTALLHTIAHVCEKSIHILGI